MKNQLNFSFFSGAELYAFVRALLKIVDSTKLSTGVLHSLAVKLETIYQSFSKGVEYDPKDPLRPKAVAADDKRDEYFNGMKTYIHSFLNSPDEATRNAGQVLEGVIRKYGWSAQKYSYDEETTAIAKCVEEMNAYYAAELALLNLPAMWLTPLAEAQAAFEAVQEERIQNGALELPTVSKFRRPLRLAITKLVETLEIFAEETDEAALKTYAAEVDELIGETMATLRAAKSRENNAEVSGE